MLKRWVEQRVSYQDAVTSAREQGVGMKHSKDSWQAQRNSIASATFKTSRLFQAANQIMGTSPQHPQQ